MTEKDKFLICYNPGSRGDFLITLLVGHGQGTSFEDARIIHYDMPAGNWTKLHYYNQWYGPLKFNNFAEGIEVCNSFRISITSDQEKLDSVLLFKSKIEDLTDLSNLPGLLTLSFEAENYYSKFDSQFDYVISFNQMFDLEFLVWLYNDLYGTNLSDQVIESLRTNITVNQEHLKTIYNQLGVDKIQQLLEFCQHSIYQTNKDLFVYTNDQLVDRNW